MPHTDGPCYYPTTVTLSIGGGNVILRFTPRPLAKNDDVDDQQLLATNEQKEQKGEEVILEGNGSLICFANEFYTDYCHSIDEGVTMESANPERCMNYVDWKERRKLDGGEEVRRGYRISLTFRHKYDDVKVGKV